jgi:hypothetical protein
VIRRCALGLAVTLAAIAVVSPADAQRRRRGVREAARDPLSAAELAFAEVDFERTLERSAEALQAGAHTPQQVVRIYQLLGVSAAALGDPDGARDFFQRMLAVDGDAELDDTVPPRLRAPYLEARGIVSARPDRLGVELALARDRGSLRVTLSDPFEMARQLRVHARPEGGIEFVTSEGEAQDETTVPITDARAGDRVEVWIEVLDGYGNQLALVGSDLEPRIVGRVAAAEGGAGGDDGSAPGSAASTGGGRSIAEEPLFWVALIGGLAVVGAGIGIGFAVDSASHVPIQTVATFGVP